VFELADCPYCGVDSDPDDWLVAVWDSLEAQQNGDAPEYVGCTQCSTMEAYENDY
jgi:hypothetical protein